MKLKDHNGLTKKIALSLLFTAATTALGREQTIPDSLSPDKRYQLTVEESEARISYHITDAATGRHLLSIPSSYQPDRDSGEFAWRQSLEPTIHWRKDSQCVAIDEQNHRGIGTVLVARRTGKTFRQVPIYGKALMRASKLPWVRGRLFFGAWSKRDTITVGIIGLVWADPDSTPPEKRHRKEFGCGFTIALADGDVVSIDPDTAESK